MLVFKIEEYDRFWVTSNLFSGISLLVGDYSKGKYEVKAYFSRALKILTRMKTKNIVKHLI